LPGLGDPGSEELLRFERDKGRQMNEALLAWIIVLGRNASAWMGLAESLSNIGISIRSIGSTT
jgi:hypothetical protein